MAIVNKAARLSIANETDVVRARQEVRLKSQAIGFSIVDQTRITTAASELIRNMLKYAGGGTLEMEILQNGTRSGLRIVCEDKGPGIPNLELAMKEGYTTGNGLGYGLPGSKRLMDDFDIWSEVGKGTRVTVAKWR
ncbi:MAG: anti-sigma regulatory factor [Nitrospirae bacterium]|nr:anti-sigma regulatory factor [Candidatus Manganitrophaceae bacterium]